MASRAAHYRISAALLGAAALCVPGSALAATAQSGTAQAQVLESIQFAVLLDMDFGKIAVGAAGGMVELDPGAGNRNCDPTLVCVGGFAMSRLQLSGSDADVVVNFDPTFTLTGSGQAIVAEPQFPGGPGAVIHLSGGAAVVNFGARLHINPNQAPGVYSGQFSVNLEYN
jgi:hypothetical protein